MKSLHRLAVSGVIAGAALLAPAAPAFANPGQGQALMTEQYFCNGSTTPTTIVTTPNGGVPGFIDGGVYLLDSITVTVHGQLVYTKTYGQRNGAGTPINCVASYGPETISVTAVPVGPPAT